ADMATMIDVARVAVWRAAVALDLGGTATWEEASARAEAAEQALFGGPNAVQILGGHGFMKDHPVEKWMRDIRTLASLAGGRDEAEIHAAEAVWTPEARFRGSPPGSTRRSKPSSRASRASAASTSDRSASRRIA